MSFATNPEDPETSLASTTLLGLWRQRVLGRHQHWLETRHSYPAEWRRAAGESQFVFYLTAAELDELTDELARLLLPRMDRLRDPALRPPGAVPVEMLLFSYPVEMPPAGPSGTDADPGDADPGDANTGGGAR